MPCPCHTGSAAIESDFPGPAGATNQEKRNFEFGPFRTDTVERLPFRGQDTIQWQKWARITGVCSPMRSLALLKCLQRTAGGAFRPVRVL